MNLRTIGRSKAKAEGTTTNGPARGTAHLIEWRDDEPRHTAHLKGPAHPIRPGFRWRVGRMARQAAARGLRQRVRLNAVDFEAPRRGVIGRLASRFVSKVSAWLGRNDRRAA